MRKQPIGKIFLAGLTLLAVSALTERVSACGGGGGGGMGGGGGGMGGGGGGGGAMRARRGPVRRPAPVVRAPPKPVCNSSTCLSQADETSLIAELLKRRPDLFHMNSPFAGPASQAPNSVYVDELYLRPEQHQAPYKAYNQDTHLLPQVQHQPQHLNIPQHQHQPQHQTQYQHQSQPVYPPQQQQHQAAGQARPKRREILSLGSGLARRLLVPDRI